MDSSRATTDGPMRGVLNSSLLSAGGNFTASVLIDSTWCRSEALGQGDRVAAVLRILSRQSVVASAEVARRLGIARGDPVLRLQRLRSLGGQPRLFEEIWLPLPLFETLVGIPLADWGDLLYPFFVERCGVAVARATDEIGFAPLTAPQARAPDLSAGHPGVTVTRQAFDLAGRCVELRVTRGDAFAFHYSVTIT